MHFLIDNSISPQVASALKENGYDAIHVRDIGLNQASDREIFTRAEKEDRILISADTDFSYILSKWSKNKPSLILFRKGCHIPSVQVEMLIKYLPQLESGLLEGSIIVFEKERIRIRKLPLF
ncbi:MAG: DUF5615 family PIN-like protein [candidate division WOR-3 bacterium]|nr:DUF5615 family PIN-like protein [candidate division WOR-3 bacterium]